MLGDFAKLAAAQESQRVTILYARGGGPWAKPKTKTFVPSEVEGLVSTSLDTNGEGYKQTGDLMVTHALGNPSTRDFLVFPILFNYRHFLELSLKYQLATFGPFVSIEPNWYSHDLGVLWDSFLEMLDRYGTPDPDEADPVVGGIVLEFAKIDPQSYSYRYPVDRTGTPIPIGQSALDLANLADVMKATDGYFSGCDGYLSACL